MTLIATVSVLVMAALYFAIHIAIKADRDAGIMGLALRDTRPGQPVRTEILDTLDDTRLVMRWMVTRQRRRDARG